MTSFWKLSHLFVPISYHNNRLPQLSLSCWPMVFNQSHHLFSMFQSINVIDSVRLRVYPACSPIFVQGDPRHYCYVMKQGNAQFIVFFLII